MSTSVCEIPLAVVGCDFRVTSSRWRSRLVLEDQEALQIAEELKRNNAGDAFVDLNTCNRNEWIVVCQDPNWAAQLLRTRMKQRAGGEEGPAQLEPYVFTQEEAVRHIFRVAIGQESLVVGERQIAGQLFQAIEKARARGTSSRILNGLGSVGGRLVRIALRRGCMGNSAAGVHSLAISFLQHRLVSTGSAKVAVIGLGSIGSRVLGLLEEHCRQFKIIRCNRTIPEDQKDRIRPITELSGVLDEIDAAIVCTGALRPIITETHVKGRAADRPLLLVDIGIPEQVQRQGLPGQVQVVGLDELTSFHREGTQECASLASEEAEKLVSRALSEFKVFCSEQSVSSILDIIQRNHRQLVVEEIPRLMAGQLAYLPETIRARLEQDLKAIVLEYTSEVFRAIKESSRRHVEGERD